MEIKSLSRKSIKLNLRLDYIDNPEIQVKPGESCLKQEKVTFNCKTVLIFLNIFYEIRLWPYNDGVGFKVGNSLFGTAKLTKNADPDKYSYAGYAHCQLVVDLVKTQ